MIFNMTGGGSGSGATLVVSCPVNVTVTVSKDDKSYTKNSGNLGSATFKGLATGEWTVTIEGNEQTATKTITVTADYAITMAFFAAYINITYPANSNCVVQNSGGVTVASDTNTDSSAKTWTATVNATGTYTITATSTSGSSKTKSTTVSITADGQVESVELSYGLYLYENGDEFNDVTGGWVTYSTRDNPELKISNRNNQLVITGELRAASNCGGTAQKVQIGSANTIRFTGTVDKINDTYPIYIALFGTKANQSTSASVVAQAKFPSVGTYDGYSVLDLSAVSAGEYYVGFISKGDNGSSFTVINKLSIDDLWID